MKCATFECDAVIEREVDRGKRRYGMNHRGDKNVEIVSKGISDEGDVRNRRLHIEKRCQSEASKGAMPFRREEIGRLNAKSRIH